MHFAKTLTNDLKNNREHYQALTNVSKICSILNRCIFFLESKV